MAESIEIDGIKYPRFEEREPDNMGVIEKNKLIIKIEPEDYHLIQKGEFIMYTDEEESRGGTLVKFIEPNYFILKLQNQRLIWTIEAVDNIYIKDYSKIKAEDATKNYLYRLYKEGYIDLKQIQSRMV